MKKTLYLFTSIIFILAILTGCAQTETSETGSEENPVVKIGVQGSGGIWGKAREAKVFEEALEPLGAKVEWVEFQSGPPMTEAMAANNLDFAGLGNMPIILAQAANIPFTVISQMLSGENNVAILLPNDSDITDITQLKGKKVAVTKGSNAYNFLYRGLIENDVKIEDVEIIQLNPDEAQAAFDSGGVDAWATWDPYITINELSEKGTVLTDGEELNILSPSFNIVRTGFAEQHPEIVVAYLKTVNELLVWETENLDEAIERYASERDLPNELMEASRERSTTINIPVSEEIIKEQQKTADFQYEIKTIRKNRCK